MKAKLISKESVLLDQIAWNNEKTKQGFISEFDPEYLPLSSTESPDTAPFGRFYKPYYEISNGKIMQKWELNRLTLDEAIQIKIQEIEMYDSSSAVNEFFIGGNSMWLDKATRVGLANTLEAERTAGRVSTILWSQSTPPIAFEMPIAAFSIMLSQLEVYSKETFDVTQRHKATVYALSSIADVEAYDFTIGYPEKLTFSNTNNTNNLQL